jgi:hypothetical protein
MHLPSFKAFQQYQECDGGHHGLGDKIDKQKNTNQTNYLV